MRHPPSRVIHLSWFPKLTALEFGQKKVLLVFGTFRKCFVSQDVHSSSNMSMKWECICSVSRYGISRLRQISSAVVYGWMVSLSAVMSLTPFHSNIKHSECPLITYQQTVQHTSRPNDYCKCTTDTSCDVLHGRGFISRNAAL